MKPNLLARALIVWLLIRTAAALPAPGLKVSSSTYALALDNPPLLVVSDRWRQIRRTSTATVTFDTHEFIQTLKAASFTEQQAEAIAGTGGQA